MTFTDTNWFVYGTDRVYLEQNGQRNVLELFGKKENPGPLKLRIKTSSSDGKRVRQNISRRRSSRK
jgi:hypothetical protein